MARAAIPNGPIPAIMSIPPLRDGAPSGLGESSSSAAALSPASGDRGVNTEAPANRSEFRAAGESGHVRCALAGRSTAALGSSGGETAVCVARREAESQDDRVPNASRGRADATRRTLRRRSADRAGRKAGVGVNLLELDELAHQMIRDRGAESCYIDYHPSFGASPFGKVLCTSVNDAVLHGLPHDYELVDGDLLSLDFACSVDGWVADSAISVIVGTPRPQDQQLIAVTEAALAAGIEAAQLGNKLGDISFAIARVAQRDGYKINTEFGGHGVGRTMHGDPHVPNNGRRGRGLALRPGLVIAIEPWFLETTDKIYTDPDGWTLRSRDGSRGAHAEHTVAITPTGSGDLDRAELIESPVDDDLVADPDLIEEPADAAQIADVDAAVGGAGVTAGGEVGGVVHRLAAAEEHRVRHRRVIDRRDVVPRLPSHRERALPGRRLVRTEAHVDPELSLAVDHPDQRIGCPC